MSRSHGMVLKRMQRLGFVQAVGLLACAHGVQAQPSGDSARVVAVARGIVSADNARDIEQVLRFYAPDAVLLPPNEAPVRGAPAIRPNYEAMFAGYDPAITTTIDEVVVTGDLAMVRGRNQGRLKSRGMGTDRELHDVYLMVLRRDRAAGWRISRLMWHSTLPVAPH